MSKPLSVQQFLHAVSGWPSRDFPPHELFRSEEAMLKGYTNLPTHEQQVNVREFVRRVLVPLRKAWDGPLRVNSCHRSAETNTAVGGDRNSYHLSERGAAADLKTATGTEESTKELFLMLARATHIPFSEAVFYPDPPFRIHVGWDCVPAKNARELLIKVPGGYEVFKLPPAGGQHV